MTRRRPHPLLSILTACFAASSLANAPARAAAVSGLHVVDAQETLERHCTWRDGRLYLALPGGAEWELVTSVDDDAISNKGDGTFHAFDVAEVEAAFAGVTFPLEGITADVYVLPYPRRASLESAAAPGLILLSPGVRPLSAAQQHAEATHELGHVVQYARMPDAERGRWSEYRTIRGITDESRYSASAPHADRPHEIFAEDFRALYGDGLATASGTIENGSLPAPSRVTGLDPFMLELAALTPAQGPALVASPSVASGRVAFRRGVTAAGWLDLFDAAGRRLASLAPQSVAGGTAWAWDGRDDAGVRTAPGVVFARTRDGAAVTRVIRLP